MAGTAAPAAAPAVVRETVTIPRIAGDIAIVEHPGNGLPPDIAYCLDAEVEFGGLGGDDRAFVDLFDVDTPAWFDALVETGGPGGRRFPEVVRERHAAWRAAAAPSDAMALDWAGLGSLRWLLDDCAHGVASDLRERLPADPGEDAILAVLHESPEAARLARIATPIALRSAADAARWGADAFRESQGVLKLLYERRLDALRVRDTEVRRLETARRAEAARPRNARQRREARSMRDRARRALSRSLSLLENLAGRERARAWLTGDAVTVQGRRFDFRLRVADLRATGHGALEVSVTDKDGIELASLCVYVPDTPALDQVSAMVLSVTSGDEDEILRRANVIRATEAGLAHGDFQEVRAFRRVEPPPDPGSPEHMARLAAAERVGALLAEAEAERLMLGPVRRALARWLAAGALAPLAEALGGPEGVAGLLPVERPVALAA